MGVDISTADKRDEFINKNRARIIKAITTPNYKEVHSSIRGYAAYLETPDARAAFAKDPKKVVEMYSKFKNSGIEVGMQDGKVTIAMKGQEPVVVSTDKLLDPQFMQTVGMVMSYPQEVVDKYRAIAGNVPSIETAMSERAKYVYGQNKNTKDLGILGQSSLYTVMDADFKFEEARIKLREYYFSPEALEDYRKKVAAEAAKTGKPAKDPKQACIDAYMEALKEVRHSCEQEKSQIAKAAGSEQLATPAAQRPVVETAKEGHSEIYDQKIEEVEGKKTLFKGGIERKKALTKKFDAIDEARKQFEKSDEVGIEILNQGIATAVVDMLKALDEIRVANPKVIEDLNAYLNEHFAVQEGEKPMYSVVMGDNKELSIVVGENNYAIQEDRTVSISQDRPEPTVTEENVQGE